MADGPKFSLTLGAKKPSHHRGTHKGHHNGTKRPHAALHDSDDEDDDGQHQEITHFDTTAGGAVNSEKKMERKAPLVIPVGENRRKKQKAFPNPAWENDPGYRNTSLNPRSARS